MKTAYVDTDGYTDRFDNLKIRFHYTALAVELCDLPYTTDAAGHHHYNAEDETLVWAIADSPTETSYSEYRKQRF